MAKYEITSPDGRKYEVTAPDDASQDDVLAYAQGQFQSTETEKKPRTAADVARDVGVTAVKGAVGLPQAFVGLADIPTGGRVGKALDTIGVRFDDAQKILDEQYSEQTKADKRYVHEADGFVDTVGRAIERPSTIATAVGESIPSMIGGAGIARGVLKAAPKVAPVIAGAIGEGAIGAGSAAEQIRGESKDGLLTAGQSAIAIASGIGTGILGFAGGKLAQKLKIGDIDTILASGTGQASAKGFVRQVLESGVSEGVFEELPQSAQEQMWQNYATGKPVMEGVENSAAMGMLAGAAMGGAGGGYNAAIGGRAAANQDAPAGSPPDPTAADVLGTPEPIQAAPTEAEKALYTPKPITALDRVAEIDAKLTAATPEEAPALQAERDSITAAWPKTTPGAETSFTTEAGARLNGQYALIEAGDLTTSHDESLRPVATYPAELQPRERERHASEMQIQQIVGRIDPARLGESADVATGAPIVGADGLVESGNARTIALKRVYQANGQKAIDYKQYIKDNAARFGITPESVDAMQKPVLVRVRNTPVNRAEFARQANQATVARMSPSEQARSDAAQIDSLDDLNPTETGDFSSGASAPFVRRFMAKLPATEQSGLIDATGQLSQAGYQRIRNAVLAKAYGDSPVLQRMVESLDSNVRNVGAALLRVAPQVAKTREAINEGALHDADLTPDLMAAVEELSTLKDKGTSVTEALAQAGMFGDKLTPESRELLAFMDENIRSPRRIAEFIQSYLDALSAAGNPAQGSMFGDTAAPAKVDLIAAARRMANGDTATGGPAAGNTADGQARGEQSQDPQGHQAGARGNETSEWLTFPPDTGTLGIPRAEMPQIKGDHRGALIQFLQGRGINHETVELPASELKPTQAEFSVKKVEGWKEARDGVDRSVLASSDGYILDGHHQWVAALAAGETEKVIRFDAQIQELLAAVREFPSVKKSEGAKPKPKAELRQEIIEQQWNDALADLGVILRDFAQVARMVPEDTPNLMPTLVKLFEAGFGKVGMQIGDLMKYVKAELRKIPEFKTVWNKLSPAIYRKAAAQALENHQAAPQGDLFAPMVEKAQQGDLFSGNTAEKVGAGATAKITIDQQEYDLDAPNFGVPSAPLVLKDDDPLLVETTMKPANSKVIFKGEEMTRAEMRKRIEDHYFSQAKPVQDGTKPIVYVMGGGGASGKGTIKGKLIAEGLIDTKNTVSLDPDEVKPHIPEYDAIVKAGDSRAAAVTHEESSDIAKRVKARATGGSDGSGPKYNLVLDATLGNPANGVAYLEDLKARGYEVRLFGVTVDPRMAVVRATNRAIKSNRWVPIKALLHAHKGFSSAFERYAEIADQARLYENSNNPILLAEKSNGILEVKDATAYNEIVERSQINERANTLREILGDSGRDGAGLQSGVQQAEQGGSGGQLVRDPGRGSGRLGSSQEQDPVRDEGGVGSREPQEGGLNENRTDRPASAQGQGPGPAQGSGGKRGAARVREWQGGGNQLADDLFGAQDGQPGRLQQDGQPNRAATDNERDPAAGEGDRPGRATGIPAGRDIPAKSGRNYSFGDGDLTYEGGWQKKAAQNVEAVELVKRLESENREATREEQAILAKFIGWGASEIRNSIFGKKLDADARAIEQYEDAQKAVGEAGGSLSRYGSGYMAAHYMLAGANMAGYRYGDPITVDLLAKAKPDMAAKKWIDLRDRLKAVMTEEEWATAERSTQYAHYTSKAVVQAMWKAVERMGFKGGAILEPGAGIGVFPGLMSPAMATNSVYTGIEFDNITGAILKHLFPDERIAVESFVDSALPDNFYDMAIGNPPFANVKILSDPAYKKHAFSLHDYFFAKSVDKVKPGGLMVYVTSRYTMDKQGDKARKYLADRADLIGAIRLPQTAFMKNAGTEVVTDVIFLRKKVPGEAQFADARAWTGVQEIQTKEGQAIINEYFAAHPEMVLGTHSLQGSMYSKNEYTVLPNKETDIEAQFAAAVENLPADIYKPVRGSAAEAAKVREIDFNPKAQKEGNYYLTDAGVLMQREGGVGVRVDGKPEKTVAVVKDFVKLRDALKQAHYDQLNDGDWETSLKALQKEYRAFVKKHGNILQNKAFERKVTREDEETGQEIEDIATWRRFDLLNKINDDPDYTLVEALAKKPAELDQRIADNTAKREALESRLDAKFQFAQELSDKIKEAEALEIAMLKGDEKRLAFDRDEWAGPTTMFSRGTGSGMALRDLQAVVDRIAKGFKNLPRVHVLSSPSDLSTKDPSQKALRDFIKKSGAWEDVEGATHDGEIYLFASGMADEARAEHVLATHEITHYGLRATMGKDLDAALQHIYLFNGKVRVAADKMKKARGLKSNVEAVEEVLADIPTADLAKLRGWRKVVQVVRNWLNQAGAKNLSARLDAWIKSGLSDQEKADLFVADLVGAARQWVKSGKNVSSGIMGGTRLADPRLADDLAAQEKWLEREAKMRGFKSIDELAEKDYPEFENLAALWRKKNPVEVALLSRKVGAGTTAPRSTGFDKTSGTVVADFKNDNPLKAHADYRAAKSGDIDAAARLVQALVKPESIEAARAFGDDAIYVPVHAEEASGRNKIPIALAAHYAKNAGGDLGTGIFQANRAYHTGANAMERLLARAEFAGKIEPGRRYVLVDDVTTMGSTLADLASYIRSQGGEVVGSVVLVNAMRGGMMTPASKTINELETRHGDEILKLFGIEPGALTWSEAQYLLGFRTTDELRNRVAKARSERSARLLTKGVSGSEYPPGSVTRLSRAVAAAPTVAGQTADDIINQKSGTARPLDTLVRVPVQALKLDKLTTAIYNKAAFFLDRFTPETIKAGMVADYGIPEAVIDARAVMEGRQRQQLRGAGKLLEKLSTLTRAESRVAYEWMNNDDPQAADYFEQQLPEESVKVLKEVRDLIDQLSQEAIRLGQLSPDAYARNKFAYLHRSYIKHTAELTKGETEGRKRAVAVLGDQYKGRGMTDAVDMAKVKNIAPEWWNRKLQQGKADKQLKGEKFIRLERRAASGEGTTALQGFSEKGKGRLLEVAYWPAGEPIPIRMSTWDQVGTWEVRDTKGNKLVVWRDFTKQEREAMGEIDEARYAIAKTFYQMIHDIEVAKYLGWIAGKYGKTEAPHNVRVVEAREAMRATFGKDDWVQVPMATIAGTSVRKFGALAGLYIPGPIWNDIRQVVNYRYQPLGETYAGILRAWKISKALALDTPIPTPSGWTTMGALKPGDTVFDEHGKPCSVLQATETQHNHQCYEVEFSDGTKIVADAGHLWYTEFRGRAGIRETREIVATLKERTRGDNNHRIPVCGALDLPEVDLPLPPYALGVWLGDGDTRSARISAGGEDVEELTALLDASGVRCGSQCKDSRNDVYTFQMKRAGFGCLRGHDASEMTEKGCRLCANAIRRARRGSEVLPSAVNQHPQVTLRELGVLGRKHIPAIYLRASEAQRMELLRGLMDTDGNITDKGFCSFTTSLPELRDGALELLRSLGYKPSCTEFQPSCNGKPGKTAWRIHFKGYADKPVFGLSRKRERLCQQPATRQRSQTRQIVAVREVPSVPVRCILVSSPSHLFLAGDGMVPTHNTALSPAVHTNNIMANFVMADWHDVTAGHIVKALRLMASKDPAAQEVWARFGEAGGTVGTFAVNELQKEQLRPLLEALEKEVGLAGEVAGKVGVIAAMQHMMRLQFPAAFDALKGSKSGQITAKGARLMLDAYEAEDQVFRLAAWLKAKEDGASDMQAGKVARKSFLDYRINAPWVQMMRGTFLPFIAFTYRAAPMALEIAAKKPWKLMKLGLVAGLLNAIGYGLSGGDEDEERKLLPEEKAGSIWGLTPKLIRMPWNSDAIKDGVKVGEDPVFLDVRRWIPVGDIFDTGATNASVPLLPSMMPGGPLALLAEFSLNKTGFTGKPITLETDTPLEKATKTADWLYKAFAPNIAVLPGTYAWTAIANAGGGKTDSFGREQSLTQAIVSSVGIKVGSYPKDVLQLNAQREVQAKLMEIDRNITALKREYQKKGIDTDEFQKEVADQAEKQRKVVEKFQERMAGG